MPAPEVGEFDDDGVVPDAALAVREAADEVWLAEAAELDDIIDEDMEDAIEETDDMADEALLETEDAAEEAAELRVGKRQDRETRPGGDRMRAKRTRRRGG